jgi:hypothetical protein
MYEDIFPRAEVKVESPLIVHIFPGVLDPLVTLYFAFPAAMNAVFVFTW